MLPDDSINNIHPFSYVASIANDDVLQCYQAMKSDNANSFREAMGKEVTSFKEEKIFEIAPIKNKPSKKSLTPFVWSFKRKRNPMGELIKYKARLCVHGGRQVKGVDCWNTCAPVV